MLLSFIFDLRMVFIISTICLFFVTYYFSEEITLNICFFFILLENGQTG